jgi:hypothetical protein
MCTGRGQVKTTQCLNKKWDIPRRRGSGIRIIEKMKINLLFALFATFVVFLSGCGNGASPDFVASPQYPEWGAGIWGVERVGGVTYVDVVLKEKYKIQLFEGEKESVVFWVRSFHHPVKASLVFKDQKVKMGGFGELEEDYDTTGVRMREGFPGFVKGSLEVQVGERIEDDTVVPIFFRLVETTDTQRSKILGDGLMGKDRRGDYEWGQLRKKKRTADP